MQERVILHCDMNNFYASVECLYNPAIRDLPVAVCGSKSDRHGIVLAKNMHAKKLGVKTGEAIWEAKDKCPNLFIVPPNYSQYMRFSKMARKIYEEYTDLVEAFGIDENWLDITDSTKLFGSGEQIAHEIRERIKAELGLTISVGVSFNKIFAKLGSDIKKPDAVTVISNKDFKDKIFNLPVQELLYVGRSTLKKLHGIAIYTIGDLANTSPTLLRRYLGKWGETLFMFANGYDTTPVSRTDYVSTIKGIGNSLTTPRDLCTNEDVKVLIYILAESVAQRLRKHNFKGKTVQITIKNAELGSIDRQAQLSGYTCTSRDIASKAYEIFLQSWDWHKNIRSFGVRVTDLVAADGYIQLSFFDELNQKAELLDNCVDKIRERFGHEAIQRAILLKDRPTDLVPSRDNLIHPVSYF